MAASGQRLAMNRLDSPAVQVIEVQLNILTGQCQRAYGYHAAT
jgi:hypothetical protein